MSDDFTPGAGRPLTGRANFLLSQLGFQIAQTFAARLAPLGIAPNHFGILTHLERGEGSSQQRLADALGIHRKVMVGLLDDLEHRGLVERRRHPDDRRAHAIHLTEAARTLLPQAHSVADQHEDEVLAALDAGERTHLIAVLQRVADHSGNPPGVHPGLKHTPARRQSATQADDA
ncbi:MarR family winged helix-turn-helix transcriptional regulator [Micromonospora sp. CPCC 205539]|uniref:MarR family winged helix-turn-helix transcriptional regulator n=1 Tax=Micromonospora sp. CPCC 205539 TaxID=3122408 RepID=UPI002FF39D16